MKRAAIIVTDEAFTTVQLHADLSEQAYADLQMAVKLMEGHRGHGYSPEQIAGGMNRLRAALEDS